MSSPRRYRVQAGRSSGLSPLCRVAEPCMLSLAWRLLQSQNQCRVSLVPIKPVRRARQDEASFKLVTKITSEGGRTKEGGRKEGQNKTGWEGHPAEGSL